MTKIDVASCFLVGLVACSWVCSNTAVAAEAEKSKTAAGTPKATVSMPAGGKAAQVVAADKAAAAKMTATTKPLANAKPSPAADKPTTTAKPTATGKPTATSLPNKTTAPATPTANASTAGQTIKASGSGNTDKNKSAKAAVSDSIPIEKEKALKTATDQATAKPAAADKSKAAADAGKSKEQAKNAKAVEPRKTAHHASGASMLVPPPPPDTPTILAVPGGMYQSFVPTDTSPANLAARKKELVAQLASAEKLLNVKNQHLTDSQSRAEQFKSLFSEGVISKRELDSAQTEAESSVTEVNDAKLKVTSLQNMILRVDERLAPKPTVKAAKVQKSKKIAQTSKAKKNTAASTDKKKGGG